MHPNIHPIQNSNSTLIFHIVLKFFEDLSKAADTLLQMWKLRKIRFLSLLMRTASLQGLGNRSTVPQGGALSGNLRL